MDTVVDIDCDDLQLDWWEDYIDLIDSEEEEKAAETLKQKQVEAYDRAMGIIR